MQDNKKRHHRNDPSIKTKSEGTKINMQFIGWLIAIVAVIYSALRGYLIYSIPAPDTFYLVRQMIYVVLWCIVGGFFMTYAFHIGADNIDHEEMKDMANKSIIAMVACILKFVLVVAHLLPHLVERSRIKTVWNVGEILFWIVLAIFFFFYYKQCMATAKQMESMKNM